MRRRFSIALAGLILSVIVAGVAHVTLADSSFGVEKGVPFKADDAFTRLLPATTVVDPDSAAMVANLGKNPGAAIVDYGVPVYYADSATAKRTVACANDGSWGTCEIAHTTVPLGPAMVPSPGTDGAMSVVDLAAGKVYDYWQYSWNGGSPKASWGDITDLAGVGNGSVSTGAGFSRLAGVVRTYEVAAGAIEHPLVFSTSYCQTGSVRYPATKTDGKYSGAGAIPEGTKFQLDPSVNVSAITNKFDRIVATALQKYGAYAMDCGGASAAFIFENPNGGTDPYKALGISDYYGLGGIPWAKMRALKQWHGGSDLAVKPALSGGTATPVAATPTATPRTVTPTPKPAGSIMGDLNGDGHVNITDLSLLLSHWTG